MGKVTRISVRVDPELKRRVTSELAREGKTLTDLVVDLLTAWLAEREVRSSR
jgi:predicted HicB family RNase H-like nuclease